MSDAGGREGSTDRAGAKNALKRAKGIFCVLRRDFWLRWEKIIIIKKSLSCVDICRILPERPGFGGHVAPWSCQWGRAAAPTPMGRRVPKNPQPGVLGGGSCPSGTSPKSAIQALGSPEPRLQAVTRRWPGATRDGLPPWRPPVATGGWLRAPPALGGSRRARTATATRPHGSVAPGGVPGHSPHLPWVPPREALPWAAGGGRGGSPRGGRLEVAGGAVTGVCGGGPEPHLRLCSSWGHRDTGGTPACWHLLPHGHPWVPAHTRVHTHTGTRVCWHTHTCKHVHTHVHTSYMHAHPKNTRVSTCKSTRVLEAHAHRCTHARSCTRAHNRAPTRTQAHPQPHAPPCTPPGALSCPCTRARRPLQAHTRTPAGACTRVHGPSQGCLLKIPRVGK